MSLKNFISSQLEYRHKPDEQEVRVISNIFHNNNFPTFEFLNQARSYYTKINSPIIFWGL